MFWASVFGFAGVPLYLILLTGWVIMVNALMVGAFSLGNIRARNGPFYAGKPGS